MPKNTLHDLRQHLFATIESLMDEDNPMDIKRAVAVSQVANAIINSAKVELRAADMFDRRIANNFLGPDPDESKKPAASEALTVVNGKGRGKANGHDQSAVS